MQVETIKLVQLNWEIIYVLKCILQLELIFVVNLKQLSCS